MDKKLKGYRIKFNYIDAPSINCSIKIVAYSKKDALKIFSDHMSNLSMTYEIVSVDKLSYKKGNPFIDYDIYLKQQYERHQLFVYTFKSDKEAFRKYEKMHEE